MGCLASSGSVGKKGDPVISPSPRRPEADPEKLSALIDGLGFSEKVSREALEFCGNDAELATQRATARTAADNEAKLSAAREAISEAEAEVAALQAADGTGPTPKQLQQLGDAVARVSCSLDDIRAAQGTELRAARRLELDRCDKLEALILALRSPASGATTATSDQRAESVSEGVTADAVPAASAAEASLEEARPAEAARLREANAAIGSVEGEVRALEAAAATCPAEVQQLARLTDAVSAASCSLDDISPGADSELCSARLTELRRCDELEARIAALRAKCNAGISATSVTAPSRTASGRDYAVPAPRDVRIEGAECLRQAGNEAFHRGDYRQAAERYREALSLDVEDVAIALNLSAAEFKLGDFESAVVHADAAVQRSGGFSAKALYRRGQALEGLGRRAEAVEAYKGALTLEPADEAVRRRLDECQGSTRT